MPRIHQNKTWQLQVPDGWKVQGRDELVSLFKPDGVGILIVLTTDEKVRDQSTGEIFHGRLSGTVRTSGDISTFRRIWSLSCRGLLLFVIYQCGAKNAEIELSEVDEILQSISETEDN
jgi:hypothetical protein